MAKFKHEKTPHTPEGRHAVSGTRTWKKQKRGETGAPQFARRDSIASRQALPVNLEEKNAMSGRKTALLKCATAPGM